MLRVRSEGRESRLARGRKTAKPQAERWRGAVWMMGMKDRAGSETRAERVRTLISKPSIRCYAVRAQRSKLLSETQEPAPSPSPKDVVPEIPL